MIRGILFTLIFLLMLIASAIAFLPLGFVINQSGSANSGLGWAQIQGTMLNGRINGAHFHGQEIGDISLNLKPISLLSFAPEYDVKWGSSGGQGSGSIKLSGDTLIGKDLRLQQQVRAIDGLTAPIRAMGGSLRLSGGAITVSPRGCQHAEGQISTDVVTKAAQQYGREFGQMEGPISCENGSFHVVLDGRSTNTDTVSIRANASLLGATRFDVEVVTQDSQVTFALSQIGFIPGENGWHYYYEQDGALMP